MLVVCIPRHILGKFPLVCRLEDTLQFTNFIIRVSWTIMFETICKRCFSTDVNAYRGNRPVDL